MTLLFPIKKNDTPLKVSIINTITKSMSTSTILTYFTIKIFIKVFDFFLLKKKSYSFVDLQGVYHVYHFYYPQRKEVSFRS